MTTPELIAQARRDAAARIALTDTSIRILIGVEEQNLARQIFDEVWPTAEGTQITANLLQALVHNGTYVSGVFIGEEIVGAAFAFPSVDEQRHLHLHSHMAAVKEGYRNRNIGSALKWHQRAWALEHGYEVITWTFDPLVRRNAKLNLAKLGVQVFDYFPDFYGDLPDLLNAGDPTDRVIARWELLSRRVIDAATNENLELSPGTIPVALENAEGYPLRHDLSPNYSRVLCYLPDDIITLRASQNSAALDWRLALRAELAPRLDSGWAISGFTSDGAFIVSKKDPLTENLVP